MNEITRYQQLRQPQKISEEQKAFLGLALYPEKELSDFANRLKTAMSDESYTGAINRFREEAHGKNLITDLGQVHPLVRSVYEWIDFKAKPIKETDFEPFVTSLKGAGGLNLTEEWNRYADNLLLAIYQKQISLNYCVDFQLLIRICYLIRLCLVVRDDQFQVAGPGSTTLVNEIIYRPILLPAGLIRSRCESNCSQMKYVEFPQVPAFREMSARDCDYKREEHCQPPDGHCLCIRTYVGDLFIIKEELARFEEGDIADIENILAGEKKERRHRTLLRTEETSETEHETDTSEERDHQVNEKFTLQSEVKNTVDSKVNIDAGVTATLKYGDTVTLTPHANVTANFSKSESESTARSYAKELIDRSVSKIQEKVRTLQVSKIINELAEHNKHLIDNSNPGAHHRAGLYYWVNKVTHAQVFNYGKHMMFDVIIPEPAALYKKLYAEKQRRDNEAAAPVKPAVTPDQIRRDNFGDLLLAYGISSNDEIQPPDDTVWIQFAFSQNLSEGDPGKTAGFSSNEFKSPDIPKGYKAYLMDYDVRCSTGHPKGTDPYDEVAVSVNVGNTCILNQSLNEFANGAQTNQNWVAHNSVHLLGEEGNLTVAIAGFSTLALSLSGTISITCRLTEEAFQKWQLKIYDLIMADYNRRLAAYKASQGGEDNLIQIKGRNPFLNREIERNEFKRHIIAILMCNYFNGMGSMMEMVAPYGYPEINFSKLEKDAPVIQFFEQVFEWSYVNYLFYHSMWARKHKWPELLDADSGDPLFDKFLMAGAARVQVPIRPGMEEVFNWFLKTGQIWGATGVPPLPGDDEYVSMIQELKESKQCDYADRPGLIAATNGNTVLRLTGSTYYWDLVNNQPNALNLDNDVDREILVNYKLYRIVRVSQVNPADNSSWDITLERPYEDPTANSLKHAVGALFVGAPWEVVIPTKLVYLRNTQDKLPTYPLS